MMISGRSTELMFIVAGIGILLRGKKNSLVRAVLGFAFSFPHDFEMFGQAIETPVPETSITFEPFENIPQWSALKMTGSPLSLSATGNQARGFKHF